jgi:hypothetical protein
MRDLLAALIRMAFKANGTSESMNRADGGSNEFVVARELMVACRRAD